MKIALRVLAAVTYGQPFESEDLQQLQSLAPSLAGEPPDELARDVIAIALQQRAATTAACTRAN